MCVWRSEDNFVHWPSPVWFETKFVVFLWYEPDSLAEVLLSMVLSPSLTSKVLSYMEGQAQWCGCNS